MASIFAKGTRKRLTESGEEVLDEMEFKLSGVPMWVVEGSIVQPTLEDQIKFYFSYVDSVNTGVEFTHYVETFCEDEEADLLELYSGEKKYSISVIDDLYISQVIREGDPLFEGLTQSNLDVIGDSEPYSFLKVSERPYKDVVMGNLKEMLDKGYDVRLVADNPQTSS